MTYLLSYPRSGNTLYRWMFEKRTGKASAGYLASDLGKILINKDAKIELVKVHFFKDISRDVTKIILLIRNPLHAVLRHKFECVFPKDITLFINALDDYFEPIIGFENTQGVEKEVVYYEELVTQGTQREREFPIQYYLNHGYSFTHQFKFDYENSIPEDTKKLLIHFIRFKFKDHLSLIERYLN